jgi:hypothetical protein
MASRIRPEISYITGRRTEYESIFAMRNERMEMIEKQYKLVRPRVPAGGGFTPVPANITRTTIDLVTAMLSGANTRRHHVPVLDDREDSKLLAGKKEVFLRSAYRRADQALPGRMMDPSLQRVLAQQAAYRGWLSCQAILEEGARDPFQIVPFDPAQSYGAAAGGRLYEFMNCTTTRYGDVWQELGHMAKDAGDGLEEGTHAGDASVEIVNYWCELDSGIFNIVLVEGRAIKNMRHDELDELPIIFMPAGGLNTRTGIQDTSSTDPTDPWSLGMYDGGWEAHAGLSAADGVAPYQAISSMFMSLMMSAFEKWVHPPKFVYTFNGVPRPISFAPDRTNWMMMNQQGQREAVESFRPSGSVPETVPLLQQLDGMMQRGSAPYTLFGQLVGEGSGATVSEAAITGATYLAGPKSEILCRAFEKMDSLLLRQYSKFIKPLSGLYYTERTTGAPPKDVVSTLDPRELRANRALSPEDLSGGAYSLPENALLPPEAEGDLRCDTEVTIRLHLPKDLLQRANATQMLRNGPSGPSVSLYHIQENVLEIEDSEVETARLLREKIEMDPEFTMARAYNDYVKKAQAGDPEAMVFAQLLARRLKIEDLHAQTALNVAGQQKIQTGAGMGPGGGPAGAEPGGGGAAPPGSPGGQPGGSAMGPGGQPLPPGVGSPAGPPGPNGQAIAPQEAGRPGAGQPPEVDQETANHLRGMGVRV